MSDEKSSLDGQRAPTFLATPERRRSRREPIATVHVEIRSSPDEEDPQWAGSAVDLNASGMALVLPPELESGARVFLTFQLGKVTFSRVHGDVVRQDAVGVGAVRFVDWNDEDKLALISYLQEAGAPP